MAPKQDCIFCRIAAGELKTEFVYQSDEVVAFNDLAPKAPTHVLVIPRRHVSSVASLTRDDDGILGALVTAATSIARDRGIDVSGYRLLTNHGEDAGQTVVHLHLHLLGGAELGALG